MREEGALAGDAAAGGSGQPVSLLHRSSVHPGDDEDRECTPLMLVYFSTVTDLPTPLFAGRFAWSSARPTRFGRAEDSV